MDKKTYVQRISEINKERDEKVAAVKEQYAVANNPVKIGDIVSDHYQTVQVDKICIRTDFFKRDLPSCSYHGMLITKTGQPFKNGKHGTVYQCNIRKINGVDVE